MARTTALQETDGSGRLRNVYAGVGAVAQGGGTLKVYVCNECGTEVVWAESKKTGRKYLANVSKGYLDQRFYMGHNVHKCETVLAQRAAEEAQRAKADAVTAWVVAVQDAVRTYGKESPEVAKLVAEAPDAETEDK